MPDVPSPPGKPDTPGKPADRPGRAWVKGALGNKYKDPATLTTPPGVDRLEEVAKANSAGKAADAKCRAFSGALPAHWKPKETS